MSTLRERIAALQQRSSSPSSSTQVSSTKNLGLGPNEVKSLKDKIASFEKRGGMPIPRSSFGLAPPSLEKASSREMYGNRFASQSIPVESSLSRSNSVASNRSTSPNPYLKRERRISSYGDSWNGSGSQMAHKRSYSAAGDNLFPNHTGTTSSDEVSSVTSSFPATPHDTSSSFLRLNESFQEDPEDYDSVSEESTSKRLGLGLPSTTPEAFRNAYDKFTSIEARDASSSLAKKKSSPSMPSVSVPVGIVPEGKGPVSAPPDIMVNERPYEDSRITPATDESVISPQSSRLDENSNLMKDISSLPASPETDTSMPVVSPEWDEEYDLDREYMDSAAIRDRKAVSNGSPSPSPVATKIAPTLDLKHFERSLETTSDPSSELISPASVLATSVLASLQAKRSRQSICELLTVQPTTGPVSAGLSTPDIMARFPEVPTNCCSPNSNTAKLKDNADSVISKEPTPIVSKESTNTSASSYSPLSTTSSKESSSKKPTNTNTKSSIPGWWDYNSDDEEVGGWATVVVTSRSRY